MQLRELHFPRGALKRRLCRGSGYRRRQNGRIGLIGGVGGAGILVVGHASHHPRFSVPALGLVQILSNDEIYNLRPNQYADKCPRRGLQSPTPTRTERFSEAVARAELVLADQLSVLSVRSGRW